jgi:hypothetical protein
MSLAALVLRGKTGRTRFETHSQEEAFQRDVAKGKKKSKKGKPRCTGVGLRRNGTTLDCLAL